MSVPKGLRKYEPKEEKKSFVGMKGKGMDIHDIFSKSKSKALAKHKK